MEFIKRNMSAILLAVFGVLALSLGFAAAFGDAFVVAKVKDAYDGVSMLPSGLIKSHIQFAWIGGIITGVLGLLALIGAGVVFAMKLDSKIVLIVAVSAAVVLLALGVAAIVCQSQLNDLVWVGKEGLKEGMKPGVLLH